MKMSYDSSSLALEVKLTPVCSQLCPVLASDLAQTRGPLGTPISLLHQEIRTFALVTL